MIKTIMENGGKVVPYKKASSHYLIANDGFDSNIWN